MWEVPDMVVRAVIKKDKALLCDTIYEDISILPNEKAKIAITKISKSHNGIVN